jgi:hypothetical protein
MAQPLEGFSNSDSGLHLESEQQKLFHLVSFHQLCGNALYVTAYKAWEELNWTYFNGSLNCPLIEIGITPYGKCSGSYSPHTNPGRIILHKSMGLTRTTLQHEMGHQWQHQIGFKLYPLMGGKGDRDDWHHCQSWAAFCTNTDAIDGVERGRYIWKKQTSRSIDGQRFKAWKYATPDGQTAELIEGDQIGTTGFHSFKLRGKRLDGTSFTREEIEAMPDDLEM